MKIKRLVCLLCYSIFNTLINNIYGQNVVTDEHRFEKLIRSKNSILVKFNLGDCSAHLDEYFYLAEKLLKRPHIVFIFNSCSLSEQKYILSYFSNTATSYNIKYTIVINSFVYKKYIRVTNGSVFRVKHRKINLISGRIDDHALTQFTDSSSLTIMQMSLYSSDFPRVQSYNNQYGILLSSSGIFYHYNYDNLMLDSTNIYSVAFKSISKFYRGFYKDTGQLNNALGIRNKIYSEESPYYNGESEVYFDNYSFISDNFVCFSGYINFLVSENDTIRFSKIYSQFLLDISALTLTILPIPPGSFFQKYYLSSGSIYDVRIPDSIEIVYGVYPNDHETNLKTSLVKCMGVSYNIANANYSAYSSHIYNPDLSNENWLSITQNFLLRIPAIKINDSLLMYQTENLLIPINKPSGYHLALPTPNKKKGRFYLLSVKRPAKNIYQFFYIHSDSSFAVQTVNMKDFIILGSGDAKEYPVNVDFLGRVIYYSYINNLFTIYRHE